MSETRSRYPYRDDREIIDAFLMGEDAQNEGSYLVSWNEVLCDGGSDSSTIANYSEGNCRGDLCIFVRSPIQKLPFFVERIANYMLEALGSDERLSREVNVDQPGGVNWRWVYEGKYILPNEPIVLCGELGVLAYRASRAARNP